ncbi:MAG TPA: NAD(P)H-hydrate dehydratase [Chiayiivirga sp.]|nr:NAD(P)H-hydrate dehydratase [Chiayiivirga sp.]
MPLYRCEDLRVFENLAMSHDAIDAYALMGRAAAASFASVKRHWPSARRLCVVCGAGNNGGDGLVLARLARMAGMQVDVVTMGEEPRVEPARRAFTHWRESGGHEHHYQIGEPLPQADVIIDALLGIGLSRAPSGTVAALIDAINSAHVPVLAMDLPSGLDADGGSAPGAVVQATRTVSFIAHKRGTFTGRGRAVAGEVELATLDVPIETRHARPAAAWLWHSAQLRKLLPPRARDAHKGRHGRVLAIGGDQGYGGAIRLCAEAALRAGAGLVSVATRAEHVAPLLTARPEAMTQAVEDAGALRALAEPADILAVGPGLGRSTWSQQMFDAAMECQVPAVIDADGLNRLAAAARPLNASVLTPHPGEAARLLHCDVATIESDRFAAAQALVQTFDAVVVLKGVGTIVAAPGETPVVIGAGNPGMASGGMGDVLTGVIAALWAQGLSAFEAACAGALLHSAAADAAVREGGERGLLASDLFPHLHRLANP